MSQLLHDLEVLIYNKRDLALRRARQRDRDGDQESYNYWRGCADQALEDLDAVRLAVAGEEGA